MKYQHSPDMELGKQKKSLRAQMDKIDSNEQELVQKLFYPKFKKDYEGRFFVSENGYGSDDRWSIYYKIEKINPEDLYIGADNVVLATFSGWSFQTDNDGKITVEKVERYYCHRVGERISSVVFRREWNKTLKKLAKLS